MVQIINRKRYDTETATEVASYWNGRGGGDFGKIKEDLYITPSKNWFIAYVGGASTQYRESCGQNSWCGSSGIRVLTPDEAYNWLEEHAKTDAIETYFSATVEDA